MTSAQDQEIVHPLVSLLISDRRQVQASAEERNAVDIDLRPKSICRERTEVSIRKLEPKFVHHCGIEKMRFTKDGRVILNLIIRAAGRTGQSALRRANGIDVRETQAAKHLVRRPQLVIEP